MPQYTHKLNIEIAQRYCLTKKNNLKSCLSTKDKDVGTKDVIVRQYERENKIVFSSLLAENDIPFSTKISKAFWRGGDGRGCMKEKDEYLSDSIQEDFEFYRRYVFVSQSQSKEGRKGEFDNLFDVKFDQTVTYEKRVTQFDDRFGVEDIYVDMDPIWIEQCNTISSDEENEKRISAILLFKYFVSLDGVYRGDIDLKVSH